MRFLLALFLLTGSLFGQLTWETRVVQLAASPKDDYVEGIFRFKNTGNYPVAILKTETTCGCTSAKVEKRVYPPGGRGELVQRYRIGWSRGLHDTGIRVMTDDSPSPTLLGMRVMIEKTAEIAPEVLWWRVGEAPSTQEATIKIVRSTELKLSSVKASTPGWTAKLVTITPGWEYRVRVAPQDLSHAQSAMVLVSPETSAANPQAFQIRARVK